MHIFPSESRNSLCDSGGRIWCECIGESGGKKSLKKVKKSLVVKEKGVPLQSQSETRGLQEARTGREACQSASRRTKEEFIEKTEEQVRHNV